MRAVVVGASSGLGRCIGIGLAQRGSQTALLARRHDRLVEAAKEAGPGTLAIACDATDQAYCKAAIDDAAAGMGGIDALVYATGVGHLARLVDLDREAWQRSFDTNVVGASLITAAALPYLTESNGSVAYLSSVSASLTSPWAGLGAYAVTKAALDKLVEAFQVEHPTVGFTRVVVGNCNGGPGGSTTEFINSWDSDLMGEVFPLWAAKGYVGDFSIEADELVRVVHSVLASGASTGIPSVFVIPRQANASGSGTFTPATGP